MMMNDDVTIDPWGSSQSTDYSRIIDKFGLSSMESVTVPNPSKLHRRGVIFAHRDLDVVLESKEKQNHLEYLLALCPQEKCT